MPVNINEFEVVMDPPHTRGDAGQGESQQAPISRGATPHEIENILRREKERLSRVSAH